MADRRQSIKALAGALLALRRAAAAADPGADLRAAARSGQTAQVSALLARGAAIDSADKDGRTALMLAAQRGHADTVKVLLDRGANANARDRQGWTAYALAVMGRRDDVLKLLPRHDPLLLGTESTWVAANVYTSCFLPPEQLARQLAALHPETFLNDALREYYAEMSGNGLVEPVASGAAAVLSLKVRPGVSCVQQQSADHLSLAIDARLVRAGDQSVLLEKTFGGGLKGLRARAVTSPAQYAAIFAELAKPHAADIYWAVVEAWLRAR